MGKGDKKSKRGKITMGTYGKTRPKKPKLKTKIVTNVQGSELDSMKKN